MADYRKLTIQLIAADGKIDATEIKLLKKALFADGKISHEEVAFLSDLREALYKKAKKTSPKFDEFYLKSMSVSFLDNGVISAEEVGMIKSLVIASKSFKSSVKKKFLDELKKKATSLAPEFEALYQNIKK